MSRKDKIRKELIKLNNLSKDMEQMQIKMFSMANTVENIKENVLLLMFDEARDNHCSTAN